MQSTRAPGWSARTRSATSRPGIFGPGQAKARRISRRSAGSPRTASCRAGPAGRRNPRQRSPRTRPRGRPRRPPAWWPAAASAAGLQVTPAVVQHRERAGETSRGRDPQPARAVRHHLGRLAVTSRPVHQPPAAPVKVQQVEGAALILAMPRAHGPDVGGGAGQDLVGGRAAELRCSAAGPGPARSRPGGPARRAPRCAAVSCRPVPLAAHRPDDCPEPSAAEPPLPVSALAAGYRRQVRPL